MKTFENFLRVRRKPEFLLISFKCFEEKEAYFKFLRSTFLKISRKLEAIATYFADILFFQKYVVSNVFGHRSLSSTRSILWAVAVRLSATEYNERSNLWWLLFITSISIEIFLCSKWEVKFKELRLMSPTTNPFIQARIIGSIDSAYLYPTMTCRCLDCRWLKLGPKAKSNLAEQISSRILYH